MLQAMKTLDDLEDAIDGEYDEPLAKVSSLPSKVLIDRASSGDVPLLKAVR